MSWQSFRENVNLAIYDGKETAILSLRVMSFGVSVAAVITLVYFYGFPIDDATKGNLLSIIKFSFFFYVTRYLVRLFYSFEPRRFIKEAWFEGLLMLLLLVDGVGDIFFGMTLEGAIFQRLGVQTMSCSVQKVHCHSLVYKMPLRRELLRWRRNREKLWFQTIVSPRIISP